MNIVHWNGNGLWSKEKKESAMSLVKKEKPLILLFHERNINVEEVIVRCSKFWKNSEGSTISVRGASRGFCIVWDDSLWQMTRSKNHNTYLSQKSTYG